MFGYLKHHPKGKTIFDPRPLNLDAVISLNRHNWTESLSICRQSYTLLIMFPNAYHLVQELQLTLMVDANHAGCEQSYQKEHYRSYCDPW